MQRSSSLFQSTLSLRRATILKVHAIHWLVISIHALLAESDSDAGNWIITDEGFQSTLSLRRATGRVGE